MRAEGVSALLRPLPWQADAWAQLQSARGRGALTHAWLFAGPQGVGKKHFAAAFAASVLCSEASPVGACGACKSCRMLDSGGHPDAHLLSNNGHSGLALHADLELANGLSFWTPDTKSKRRDIGVDAARSLIAKLATLAHLGGERIVVVSPAADMSASAANALLKTVEEPPARTTVIFVTEFAQSLPQTIRSRCQLLRFATPQRGTALSWLLHAEPMADASLLDAAGGAPLLALDWLKSGEAARRTQWERLLLAVASRAADPIATAAEIGKDKEQVAGLLRFWQTQLAKLLRATPEAWGQRHELFFAQLNESRWRLEDGNGNPQMLLESLLLRWRAL